MAGPLSPLEWPVAARAESPGAVRGRERDVRLDPLRGQNDGILSCVARRMSSSCMARCRATGNAATRRRASKARAAAPRRETERSGS
eukprot:9489976-Pyramimonas_sp.AAC.1